jgi:hypothetical protein
VPLADYQVWACLEATSLIASSTALVMLLGSAAFLPAMSNAVPLVGAGADDGQTDGDVHRAVASEQLDGDQALIVVHGDDAVELAVHRGDEDGVAGGGPVASVPFSLAMRIAGAMMRSSSSPRMPPSPAWGLRPQTVTRGWCMPRALHA